MRAYFFFTLSKKEFCGHRIPVILSSTTGGCKESNGGDPLGNFMPPHRDLDGKDFLAWMSLPPIPLLS
jgi:hypothetical protein